MTEGPLFRAVRLGGRISGERLKGDAVARITKRYISRIGGELDPASFSAHSMRSGFLTSAAEAGSNLLRMADHSRHKSLQTLRIYMRHVDMWKEHPGAGFL